MEVNAQLRALRQAAVVHQCVALPWQGYLAGQRQNYLGQPQTLGREVTTYLGHHLYVERLFLESRFELMVRDWVCPQHLFQV